MTVIYAGLCMLLDVKRREEAIDGGRGSAAARFWFLHTTHLTQVGKMSKLPFQTEHLFNNKTLVFQGFTYILTW